jgi:hypothetical protein
MKNKFLISVFAILFLVTLVGAGDYKFQNQSGYDLMVIGGNGDVNMSHYLNLGNGSIWFNDTDSKYYYYNETAWIEIGTGAGSSSGATTPENAVMAFNQGSCPAGWVLADGTSGTPDLRGIFIRGAGTSGIMQMANGTNFSATYGQYQNDSMQGHEHNISVKTNADTSVFTANVDINSSGWQSNTPDDSYKITTSYSSENETTIGEPRTGAETRPASYALIYCVKTDTEDSSNALFQRLGQYISFLNVTDVLNISSGNISLKGGLFYNDNGVLKWNGVEVGTGGNTTINYGQNESGAFVPLSVDGSGILNLNVVGVASNIWEKVGNVVQLVNSGNVVINGSLSVGDLERSQCPENWILVPGDSNFTNNDFCVMKYEAKEDSNKKVVSQATGTPFVSLSQYEAKSACERVGAHLCTMGEAVTIARNIEATTINDMDDDAGLQLATGHSDNVPASALSVSNGAGPVVSGCSLTSTMENSANNYVAGSCEIRGSGTDANGYNGTGQVWSATGYSAGLANKAQLRIFVLSNREVIWDFSGNVWEWTDNLCGIPWNTNAGYLEWNNAGLTDWEKYIAGPLTSSTSVNGVGQFYGCTANGDAFVRGGFWDGGADAGAFALSLTYAPSASAAGLGFRCCK